MVNHTRRTWGVPRSQGPVYDLSTPKKRAEHARAVERMEERERRQREGGGVSWFGATALTAGFLAVLLAITVASTGCVLEYCF